MREERYIWEYSFDLDINKLKLYYGKPTYTHAYDDMAAYLKKAGFDNKDSKQGSCYFTSKKYTSQEVNKLISKMIDKLPWLAFCLREDALTIKEKEFYKSADKIKKKLKNGNFIENLNHYYETLGVPNPFTKGNLDDKLITAKDKMNKQKRTRKSYDKGKEIGK